MLILYGVAERPLPSPLPPGAAGEPLVQLDVGGVVGIAGAVEQPPEPGEEAVLRHARVVEQLTALAEPLLPARFGSMHRSPEALGDALRAERDALAAALREVEGCVEVGVRGLPPQTDSAEEEPRTGREYLERRRRGAEAARELRERVHRPLAAQARAARLDSDTAFAASYLVPRERLDGFLGAVRSRAAEAPELGLVASGPWPPYSFAGSGP